MSSSNKAVLHHEYFTFSDNMRSAAGLSTETVQVTPSERLFLSLVCPLPNEQDFAINVCSLLAMENRQPFQLQQCPRILDALLAHAGVFSQGNSPMVMTTTTPTWMHIDAPYLVP